MNLRPTDGRSPDVFGAGLPAAVLDFSRGGFNLGRDLSDLHALYRDERTPAVLFYCGRILEMLLAGANELYFGEATTSAGPNLRRLADLGVLRSCRLAQLEALRHLALDAIWTRRPIHWADANCAVLLLERLLLWFFVELPRGPSLPLLGSDTVRATAFDAELASVLRTLDGDDQAWRELPVTNQSAFLRTPVLPALYLERALREGESLSTALGVADDGIKSFAGDVRLGQVHATILRKRRATGNAIAELEGLNRRHPNDFETLRLLGDAYYDVWQYATPTTERELTLRKALRAYQEAWSRSYETDNHSGMQAALLGLLRGRAQRAELVAQNIFDSYLRRFRALGAAFRFADIEDRIRLAHCALLLGDSEFARRRYQAAFARPETTRSLIDATKQQIKALLLALDLPSHPGRFLSGKTTRRRKMNALQLELPLSTATSTAG
jgi:hypothetical protein